MFKVEVKGLDKLNKYFDNLKAKLPTILEQSIMELMKNVADIVILQAPEDTGKLKSSIKYEILDVNSGEVKGRVYSDINIAPYALWVNYGTGIYASGEGGSRAEKIPWFVHESMADLSKYNYDTYISPTGDMYYIIYGMKPRHFMDNVGFEHRNENIQTVVNKLKELIEEV